MSTQHPDGENPHMPHSVQSAQAAANTEAVQRARNQATVVTCAAATVPTVLAMQGMASLAVDLLHFPVVVAIALAGFLELALISFALLTRASALAGRPGGVDAAAVWGVSLASGTFSALHELVGPAIGSTRAWQVDPGSLLAACVRLTAPLVAALLWERVLTAARREHEARSLVQVRRDHRLIAVAKAALTVRQLSEHRTAGRQATARLRRARRRLQRAHVTALRMTGVGPDLFEVLAAVGAVDILPAATIPTGRSGTRPDTRGAQVSAVLTLSDTLSDTAAVLSGGADTGLDTLDGDPSGAVALSDTSAGAGVVLDPLTIAVELVRNDRKVAGSRIAAAMRRHGHTVTDRTGLRWRGRAVDHLDAEVDRTAADIEFGSPEAARILV